MFNNNAISWKGNILIRMFPVPFIFLLVLWLPLVPKRAPNAAYYKSDSIDSGSISELSLASLYQSAVEAQSFI